MDRLRSLMYFIAAAEEGSFSAAARRMDVTIPAVAKLVATLERDLGVKLFERSPQGLVLTGAGQAYLEACRAPVDALAELDEQMRGASSRATGTVVLGIQHVAAKELLAPALPRFHARHPEIEIDLRESTQMTHALAPGVDLYLSFAWPKSTDMVHRPLAGSTFRVCASREYWAARGMPREPEDLRRHDCVLIRTQTGTVMDVWSFAKAGERRHVTVRGWMVCDNVHRQIAIAMALRGQGVVRILDWANRGEQSSGALVPALPDWECVDAPPVVLSYRPGARRVARVRIFIDFLGEIFRELEGARRASIAPAPFWAGRTESRVSSMPPVRRSSRAK